MIKLAEYQLVPTPLAIEITDDWAFCAWLMSQLLVCGDQMWSHGLLWFTK
jgi:hypothetical protein